MSRCVECYVFSIFSVILWCNVIFFIFISSQTVDEDPHKPPYVVQGLPASLDGRLLIIGDVHGCYNELQKLLEASNYQRALDQIIFVGDMVGKGPLSIDVLHFAIQHDALCVRGNHEQVLLSWHNANENEKPELWPSYLELAKSLTLQQWQYLQSCPLFIKLDQPQDIIIAHAGIDPSQPLSEQDATLIMNMRSRNIAGLFTSNIQEGQPWIEFWKGPELVIFGHDATRGIQKQYYNGSLVAIGLDSGVVYGKQLTALALPDMKLINVQAEQIYKEP